MNKLARLSVTVLPAVFLMAAHGARAAEVPMNAHCQGAVRHYGKTKCLLDSLVAARIVPGASVLILKDGRESYFHASGVQDLEAATPVRRDTLFRIYSMTKPVTAVAMMVLVDEGKVRLDDPVTKYIPEFSRLSVYVGTKNGMVETVPARPMTIADLLTHTAGFTYAFQPTPVGPLYLKAMGDPNAKGPLAAASADAWRFDGSLGGLDGLAKTLATLPLVSQPGERWHYSMSMDVAGIVIERASGVRLDAFFQTKIFSPLGMRDTSFSVAPMNAGRLASLYTPGAAGALALVESGAASPLLKPISGFSGGGGLVSTIGDYGRFAQMLASGGELGGHRILTKTSAEQLMTNHLRKEQLVELPPTAIFGLGGSGKGLGFGYGGSVVVDPEKLGVPASRGEYAWGGAASTTFWVDPVEKLVVVFMTQVLPPSTEMLRDKLHVAVYGDILR